MSFDAPAPIRNVTVACAQMACTWDRPANVARAEGLIRAAASRGAQIIQNQHLRRHGVRDYLRTTSWQQ